MRIFVVDDSKAMREQLGRLLRTIAGVEVSGEAESAPKAIRMINTTHPDVVILDLEIEGGTGIDVLRKVKKGKASPVVIMLTNYSSQPYRKGCFEAGADYFFDKSSELQDMCDVLHNCVADQSDV